MILRIHEVSEMGLTPLLLDLGMKMIKDCFQESGNVPNWNMRLNNQELQIRIWEM